LFDSLDEVRKITTEWLERYTENRPHHALGSLPPARYSSKCSRRKLQLKAVYSTKELRIDQIDVKQAASARRAMRKAG
jgi:hypothetical protein